MCRSLWLLLGLMLCAFSGQAQEMYRAVFAGGRTYAMEETRFSMITHGEPVAANAEVELVGNSLLVLMDEGGRLVSFSQSGRYDLSKLNMTQLSDSSAFIYQVWETFYKALPVPDDPLQAESGREAFELMIPSSSQVLGDEVFLCWPDMDEAGYELRLINEFGEVFHRQKVAEAELKLNLLRKDLLWKQEVTLQVVGASTRYLSPLYTLDRLAPPDYEHFQNLLKNELTGEDFAVLLTKSAFFENQWLFADAITTINELRESYGAVVDGFWQYYLERKGQ